MADISALGNLAAVEPLDFDQYPDAKETKTGIPPKGTYTLQAPASFPMEAFSATKAGQLQARIDPTIIGPTHAGYEMRYITVSSQQFDRGAGKASKMGDYLRATNPSARPRTASDLVEAVQSTAGAVYQASVDWNGYYRAQDGSEVKINGMENFPRREDGTYQPFIEHETDKDEQGNPVKIWARLRVKTFIPATQ